MKLPTKLVAVKKINSDVARSQFPAEDIEQAAQLIIAVEGVINPIILKRTSLEAYEVVEGHLEYYAAVRAREINPLKGEMIQAIILEPDNEKAILAQVDCLRSRSTLSSSNIKPNNYAESSTSSIQGDFEFRLINLEKIFQSQFEELRKDNRELGSVITDLQKKLGANPQLNPELLVEQIANKVIDAVGPIRVNLNKADESELRTVPQVGKKTAAEIIERRETKGAFTSVDELRDLSSFKQIKRNPQWSRCFTVG
ncbi:MAG: hypothetical protein F6K30_28395 [Cyanothece sp. SIO2G6]|nr:hypothetical protein [Cyanothece sp. SIO2G6]